MYSYLATSTDLARDLRSLRNNIVGNPLNKDTHLQQGLISQYLLHSIIPYLDSTELEVKFNIIGIISCLIKYKA